MTGLLVARHLTAKIDELVEQHHEFDLSRGLFGEHPGRWREVEFDLVAGDSHSVRYSEVESARYEAVQLLAPKRLCALDQ